jgi:hypothetical protein
VEELAQLLSTIPATRYARTLRLMLAHRKRRYIPANVSRSTVSATRSTSEAASQQALVSPHQQHAHAPYMEEQVYQQGMAPPLHHRMMSEDSNYSNAGAPIYAVQGPPRQFAPILNGMHGPVPPHMQEVITPTDYQMSEFPPDQMPIWMSDHNLGDAGYGLEAFIVPQQYESQIW